MITLVYRQRLGDILQMLPAAKYLNDSGKGPVFIHCQEQYRVTLDLVTYADWTESPKGEVIDLEIWPDRYADFRQSKQSWMDFIYADPRIIEADRAIVLDNLPDRPASGLSGNYNLLAADGISQGFRYPLQFCIDRAREQLGEFTILHAPSPMAFYAVPHWSAPSIVDLALAIRDARHFMCINSAPAILASAVRRDRPTYFLPQQGSWAQDNCAAWPGRLDWDGEKFRA